MVMPLPAPTSRRWAAAIAAAVLTVAVTGAALGALMRLDRARWDVPFEYDGDSLLMQTIVQTALEQPWYLATPRLGAPDGQAMYDYPCADTLDILLVKLIGIFERRPAVAFNLVYLLTYPLAALAMLYAARRLGLGWTAAVAAGVLFAFLPYHALRGQRHFFLTTYFPVPFLVTVVVEIAMGRLPFFPEGEDGRTRFRLTDGRTVRAAVTALVCGAANPYYGFFALLLLPVAGLVDLLTRRRGRGMLSAALVAGLLAASVTANTLPSLVYLARHGPNPTAHARSAEEAELYCLKFTQLLLPAPEHRSEWGRWLRAAYRPENRPLENENTSAALGVVGAAGFLGLLAVLLAPRPTRPPRVTALAQMNLAAFLFGTFGGPHILSLVTEVATRALKAVWYQKWFVHRRLRPEAFAGLVHHTKSGTAKYPVHPSILNAKVLDRIFSARGTYLLPTAFPEGCPTHPSYGSGHATVAGACVTILKAWFDETFVLPRPVVPDRTGRLLNPYSGPDLTVGHELDKLAANVATGRNAAGIHYRSDYAQSVLLGEALALDILEEQKQTYNEDFSFTLTRFDGKTVTI